MKDVTKKYIEMISAFSADFNLITEYNDEVYLEHFIHLIKKRNEHLMRDIDLLSRLEFDIRHGKVKIMEVTNDLN